jgi:PST family polysaccharide transporter
VINSTSGWLFITQRRSGELARWSIFSTIVSITAFIIGLPYGAIGVATAYAIGEYLKAPLLWWYATRRGPVNFKMVASAVLPQIVSSIVACLLLSLAKEFKLEFHALITLIIGLVISYGSAALTMTLFPSGRETLKQSLATIKKVLLHMKLTA